MALFRLLSLSAAVLSAALLSCTPEIRTGTLIKNVAVFDTETRAFLPGQYVLIQGDTIAGISDDSLFFAFAEAEIEGRGLYMVPGFTEMHAHIPTPSQRGEGYVTRVMDLYARGGITTVRGMLGDPFHLDLRRRVLEDSLAWPRIFTSGPSLNGNTVRSVSAADSMVRAQKEAGYDFLKLHPGLSREHFDAIVATAKEVGIPFAGHVSIDVGVRHALASGYAGIDHIDGFVEGLVPEDVAPRGQGGFFGFNYAHLAYESLIPELVQQTVESGTWIIPTHALMQRWCGPTPPEQLAQEYGMQFMDTAVVAAWVSSKNSFISAPAYTVEQSERFIELRDKILYALYKGGAKIAVGSDAPQVFNVPGFSIHHEMEAMVRAGIPASDVLIMATYNPALYFGEEDRWGSIKVGHSADLVLLRGNPLDNISNTRKIEYVFVRGSLVGRQ